MNYKNDELEVDKADLKRKSSAPVIGIGTDQRVIHLSLSFIKQGPIKLHQRQLIIL